MSDIFKEVEEDLRRERFTRLWKRYGRHIIIAAVVLVVGTAAGVGWNAYRDAALERDTRALIEANEFLTVGPVEGAGAILDDLADDSGGIGLLARFDQARLAARQGDRETAAHIYARIRDDGSVPRLYRDLARLLAVYARFDRAPVEEVEKELEPLVASDNPWRHSAKELLALAAVRRGDQARARQLLSEIAGDPSAPTPMRGRIAEMIDIVGK